MRLIVISGLSGSGKSIALNVLEDAGFYCVDNLPSWLLPQLVGRLEQEGLNSVAVAVDVRGGNSIRELPHQIAALANYGVESRFLFLDAKDETLIQRFSETRRRHPLVVGESTLPEAIAKERQLLGGIATLGHRVDTSGLKPGALREWVRQFVGVDAGKQVTLVFQSFGFKRGAPLDADLVFDVRCLPNPFYEPELRPQSGRDPAVAAFLEQQEGVDQMYSDIHSFVTRWLPAYVRDGRSYLTIGVGCTGGQHRSVYLVERLGRSYYGAVNVLVRHRELASAAAAGHA
ncbi:MAG TPA: RNase adapter RapZ [Rhodocyclaceae bacterium]|nr:RNase adapter RapZ [Rhodocyclaceae bacterium]